MATVMAQKDDCDLGLSADQKGEDDENHGFITCFTMKVCCHWYVVDIEVTDVCSRQERAEQEGQWRPRFTSGAYNKRLKPQLEDDKRK
jgi:hypothetical protein